MGIRAWINRVGRRLWLDGLIWSVKNYHENGPLRAPIVLAYASAPGVVVAAGKTLVFLLFLLIDACCGTEMADTARRYMLAMWLVTGGMLLFGGLLLAIAEFCMWLFRTPLLFDAVPDSAAVEAVPGNLTPRSYYPYGPGARKALLVLFAIVAMIGATGVGGLLYTSHPVFLFLILCFAAPLIFVINFPYRIDVRVDQVIEVRFLLQRTRINPADIRAVKSDRHGLGLKTRQGRVDFGPRTFADSDLLLAELRSVNPQIEFPDG
jgi:hypothetical protein